MPAPNTPDAAEIAAARQFNRTRLALYAEAEQRKGSLVGARTGSAVPLSIHEMLVYEIVAEAEDRGGEDWSGAGAAETVVARMRARLATRGMSLLTDTQAVEDNVRKILAERVPIWRAIGAL